ncbi:acyl carrier protein [Massilia sp. IC2-477]|uniref:acyl carrier protein n=1 Tax=unclassified Massilia TaxID=2609279 RepID=UPI001D0F79A6|nr:MULTISPECIES: acyl carrier protein [unclassified Massilia]MCC2957054.1 acyl carrier protein [Massilia sp. IC2-477]MCC2970863.1 acyl carrier protein [Massilia sp. IC2-476]
MTVQTFIENFAEALEMSPGELSPQSEFKELANWDSLAALTVIAMTDEKYNVAVGGADLEQSRTLQELWDRLAQRIA